MPLAYEQPGQKEKMHHEGRIKLMRIILEHSKQPRSLLMGLGADAGFI